MICRLCVRDLTEEPITQLFCGSNETGLVKIIAKYLFLELTENDSISTSICLDCSMHLTDFHNFCNFVDERQVALQKDYMMCSLDAKPQPVPQPPVELTEDTLLDMKGVFVEPETQLYEPTQAQEQYSISNDGSEKTVNAKKFKIIAQEKVELRIVPLKWEHNGTLYWPAHLSDPKIQRLQRDGSSVPDYNKWTTIQKCKVKALCGSFKEADDMVDEMSDSSETDCEIISSTETENNDAKTTQRKMKDNAALNPSEISCKSDSKEEPQQNAHPHRSDIENPLPKQSSHNNTVEQSQTSSLAHTLLPAVYVPPANIPTAALSTSSTAISRLTQAASKNAEVLNNVTRRNEGVDHKLATLTVNQFNNAIASRDDTQSETSGTALPFVLEEETDFEVLYRKYCMLNPTLDNNAKNELLLIPKTTMKNMLHSVFAYPTLLKNYTELKMSFDRLVKSYSALRTNFNPQLFSPNLPPTFTSPTVTASSTTPSGELVEMKPIDTKDEIRELERKLGSIPEYNELWTNYLCEMYGTSGQQINNGVTCAYNLIEKVFTRKVLVKCSWSGASRSAEQKICFKSLVHIIAMFSKVVKLADPLITTVQLENFFKNILNNSGKRAAETEGVPKRKPHTKKRKKLLYYQLKKNAEFEDIQRFVVEEAGNCSEETVQIKEEKDYEYDYD